MTLLSYRGPLQLTHAKHLNCVDDITSWWTCVPTSIGRCGIQNMCGQDIKKFIMRLRGNIGGPIDRI